MITQDFPEELLQKAREKLENSSCYKPKKLSLSFHCIDSFADRFLQKWLDNKKTKAKDSLLTFIENEAEKALLLGEVVKDKRHKADGVVIEYKDIRWVFTDNNKKNRIVITCFGCDN